HGGETFVARRRSDGWTIARPAGLEADAPQVDELAGALRNFRGVALAPEVERIRKPTAVAIFTTTAGEAVRLDIGEQQADKTWLVAPSTRDDVLLVADYLVQPLLQAPAALTQAR